MIVRSETPADIAAIFEINRLAFGQDAEARLVNSLRDGGYATLSLVAEFDGEIVGHLMLSPMLIVTDAGATAALALAPMAVAPAHQRRGIGTALVREALRLSRDSGHAIITVLGHPNFYPRFGFSSRLAESLQSPFGAGDVWMALELSRGALTERAGTMRYSPPFSEL